MLPWITGSYSRLLRSIGNWRTEIANAEWGWDWKTATSLLFFWERPAELAEPQKKTDEKSYKEWGEREKKLDKCIEGWCSRFMKE